MNSFFSKGFQHYARSSAKSAFFKKYDFLSKILHEYRSASSFSTSASQRAAFSEFARLKSYQMQAIRASASYSLVLSLQSSLLINPEMAGQGSLTEELEEDDDA